MSLYDAVVEKILADDGSGSGMLVLPVVFSEANTIVCSRVNVAATDDTVVSIYLKYNARRNIRRAESLDDRPGSVFVNDEFRLGSREGFLCQSVFGNPVAWADNDKSVVFIGIKELLSFYSL